MKLFRIIGTILLIVIVAVLLIGLDTGTASRPSGGADPYSRIN